MPGAAANEFIELVEELVSSLENGAPEIPAPDGLDTSGVVDLCEAVGDAVEALPTEPDEV